MLRALNQLIIRISSSGWLFLATVVLAFGSLAALLQIGQRFPAVAGGAEPFDLQNALTAGQVLEQLPLYTEAAYRQYYLFTAIDYLFPLAAGLFQAAIATFCLRYAWPRAYAAITARQLLPLLLLATLFDWCENIAAITAITAWPDTTATMAGALVAAKKLKLGFLGAAQGVTLLLLAAAVVRWVMRRLGR